MKHNKESEYLTVKEFAEVVEKKEAGIYKSVQTGRLKDYSKKAKKNGKKVILISKKAISLYKSIEGEKEEEELEEVLEKNSTDFINNNKDENTRIDEIKKELEEARQTIKKKDEQIIELTLKITGLAEKLAELTYNSQVLLKGEQEKKKGIFERIVKKLAAPKNKNEQ